MSDELFYEDTCVVILQQRQQCLMAAVLQLGYRFYIYNKEKKKLVEDFYIT